MLTDPTWALQEAIRARLLIDPEIAATVDGRVYDRIQNSPTFPYISFGEVQVLPELAEQTDATRTFVTLNIWDRFKSSAATKALAKRIIALLHDASDLLIDGSEMQSVLLDQSRSFPDPDGLTMHSVLTFNVLTDAAGSD